MGKKPKGNEKRFREIVDLLPAAVFETDLKGKIVFINGSGCEILGYSRKEILGRPFTDFIAPEDLSRSIQTSINVMAGKFMGDNEFTIVKKDGARMPSFIQSMPYKDDLGELLGLRGILIDITRRKSVEAELRESEQKYRTLVNNLPLGVQRSVFGGNGRFIEVNKAMEEIHGYSREELQSMNIADLFVNSEDQQEFERELRQHKKPIKREFKIRKKDGSEILTSTNVTPVLDNQGNIIYLDAIIEDITEPKKIEEQVRQLAAIAEYSQDAIYGVTLDGIVTSWNVGAENTFGYTAAEILGKPVSILVPDDRRYETSFIMMKIRQKEYIENFETIALKKDGQRIYASLTICPIVGPDDRVTGISNICRDISEHKKTEEILQNSEEKYRSLVNNIKLGIIRSTSLFGGSIIESNKAFEEITGYSRDELLSIKMNDLFANHEECEQLMNDVIKEGKALSRELLWVRKDGIYIMVAITVNPKKDQRGEIIYMDSIVEDITVRKMAEEERKLADEKMRVLYRIEKAQREELQEESNARGMFISALAHELRTPLTPILNSTEILRELIINTQPYSIQGKLIDNVVDSSQNLARRLEELLDLGAASRGTFKLRLQPAHLKPLFEGIVTRFQPMIKRHAQELIAEIPEVMPEAVIDPARLDQVVFNLLSNASKFSPDTSKIILIVKIEGGKLQVDVKDQGIGISPEDQERLFKPYHRVEQDRQRYPGAGLGLAVCKQIIQAHEGKIWITSDGGRGSTFSFWIPVKQFEK
jgi:PAS domain S-box-containing protein